MSQISQEFQEDFSKNHICQLVENTFVEHVNYHTEVDSTNTLALKLAHDGAATGVTLVVAERQTAGRGRGENRWWSAPGALTFSLLFPAGIGQPATADWPKVSLATGLAVSDALERFAVGRSLTLKWPNDVFLLGRKVAGVLVEGTSGDRGALVVGVGVNVNNSLAGAPTDVAERAISVSDVLGHGLSRIELLRSILDRLRLRLAEIAAADSRWLDDWRQKCLLTGRSLEVDTQNGRIAGNCLGLDDEGALVVQTPNGVRRCLSGVVTSFAVDSARAQYRQ